MRDLDRAAVERVGAARREQHGVEAERGAAAEDRADVGVVDDVLEHQHGAGAGQHLVDRRAAAAARSDASAPRCTWKPVTCSASASRHDVAGRVGGGRARRRARRASAAPSGTTAAGSRPRPRGVRPSRPRRGTARARPRGACAAGRRAGRGSRRAAGRPGRRPRRSVGHVRHEVLRMRHRDDLADHDDRRRPDAVRRSRSAAERRRACESTVRSAGIDAVADDRDRGARGAAAARPAPSAIGGAFSTAIISTRVPRSRATASQSTSESGWPGGRCPETHRELVGDAAVGDRDAGHGGHGDRAGEPGDHGDRHAGRRGRPRPPRSRGRRRSCRRP